MRRINDEQPQEAIQRMGVGFFRPIEIHHGTDSGEASTSQQGAPTSSHDPAPTSDANNAPTQEQCQDPSLDQAVVQEPSTQCGDSIVVASQGQVQDLDQSPAPMGVDAQNVDQGHDFRQDGDSNDQDDQEISLGLIGKSKSVVKEE